MTRGKGAVGAIRGKAILLQVIIVVLASSPVAAALPPPAVGAPARALAFTDILQAPSQAKVDWASLKGKTVVLDFWATWCTPCVAELPLLNALIASSDSAKVQLIAADFNGEDRSTILDFLEQHPISGWIGLDSSKATQRRFGVTEVPVTFIIGPNAKVAYVTEHPETLTGAQLTALADGKDVSFDETVKASAALLGEQKHAAAAAERVKIASLMETNGKILVTIDVPGHAAAVTLAEAASAPDDGMPADLVRTAVWGPGRFNLVDGRVQDLVAQVFGDRSTRVAVLGASTDKRYNLHVDMPSATPSDLRRALKRALASGFHFSFERKTMVQDVLELKATAALDSHLDDTNPVAKHYCYYVPLAPPDRALTCASGSFNDLADAIEEAVEIPVLDETGLRKTVTFTLPVSLHDQNSIEALLSKNLGLTLTANRRPITMLVVTRAQ